VKQLVTFRQAITDPNLLGWTLEGDSWIAWRALGIAAFGEALTDDERAAFSKLTLRDREPLDQVEELDIVAGRRAGKTRSAGAVGAYIAALCDFRDVLSKGERGVLLVMSPTTQQSNVAFRYMRAFFTESPHLAPLLIGETADTLRLSNGNDILIKPANFRTIRGITCVGVICDEICFWRTDDAQNPDHEILAAVRPTLATTGGLLVQISSPHAKRGVL
jgi:phage terminase large subunit-like protein